MRLLRDHRVELDASEYRMLRTLCGYLSPSSHVVSLAQLRGSIDPILSVEPHHDMAALAQDLLSDLLAEAEELFGLGSYH